MHNRSLHLRESFLDLYKKSTVPPSREEKREIHSRSKESSSMDRCKGHLGRGRNDFVVAIHSLLSEDLTRLGAPLLSRVTCLKEVDGRFTQTFRFK